MTAGVVDIGPPHNYVLQGQVDSSNQDSHAWTAYWDGQLTLMDSSYKNPETRVVAAG